MRIHVPFLLGALCASVSAQCQFSSLSSTVVGDGCNVGPTGCCKVVALPTQLQPVLDVVTCTVQMNVHALSGCCGVTVPLQALVLGAQPTSVPLPEFGPLCTLHVLPDVFLVTTTATFTLPIPPTLPPITFLAQAAAHITSPFPAPTSDVLTFTAARAISLQ